MKASRRCQTAAAIAAALTWVVPVRQVGAGQPYSLARSDQPYQQVSRDVSLDGSGRLSGRLVDQTGRPVAQAVVVLWRDRQVIAQATTDENGQFAVDGLGGGLYRLTAEGGELVLRAWIPNMAPPGASDEVVLVSGEYVIRGQGPSGNLPMPLLLVGLGVAAAIAIPIALNNNSRNYTPPAS